MKQAFIIGLLMVQGFSAVAGTGQVGSVGESNLNLSLNEVRSIICRVKTIHNEMEPDSTVMPNIKDEIYTFVPGSRADVKPRQGAFLATICNTPEGEAFSCPENYGQYYLSDIKDGKLNFSFIASWKAAGELTVKSDLTATGYESSKGWVRELECSIQKK